MSPSWTWRFLQPSIRLPPIADPGGWTVYIQTHFLGGRRHFYNWEVADIGLLVIFRDRGKVLRIKVGLLQSKRLYPIGRKQLPDLREKFQIGFATLLKTPEAFRVLASGRTFTFSNDSEYAALTVGDDQEKVIPAETMRTALSKSPTGYHPTFGDVMAFGNPFAGAHQAGWRLEHLSPTYC